MVEYEKFIQIINGLEGDGFGKEIDGNYYICNKEQRGIYRDKPYTKPAHILIRTNGPRYKIEDSANDLKLLVDPDGKFNFQEISNKLHVQEINRFFDLILQFVIKSENEVVSPPKVEFSKVIEFVQGICPDCPEHDVYNSFITVKEAIESPPTAFEKCKEQLSERGIYKPVSNLYQLILVDELINQNLLLELDWKTEINECINSLKFLLARKNLEISILDLEECIDIESLIRNVNKRMFNENQVIVGIAMDADNYLFVIVQMENLSKLQKTGKSIGLKIKFF